MRVPNTKTFSVLIEGEDGQIYQGDFTCRRLSLADIVQMNKLRVQHTGGFYYDPDAPGTGIDESSQSLASMIAHLQVAIIKAPEWWNLNELGDMEVISKVFQEVAAFHVTFRRRGHQEEVAGGPGGRSEGAGPEDNSGANGVGEVGDVVGGEVRTSLEP